MNQLQSLIRENFRLAKDYPVTSETRLTEDLDADSFQMIMLAVDIEQTFAIDLHDKFLDEIKTVGALQDLIDDLTGERRCTVIDMPGIGLIADPRS